MIPLVNPALARQSSSAAQPWLRGAVRWIVVVLALVATVDAAYLTWTSFTHGVVAGCGVEGHGGCDDVLTSQWSRAAGMPIALGGLLCYGAILGLALAAESRAFNENRWFGTALATAALLAAAAGIWFTMLQAVQLHAFCYYCLGTHLCGLVIAGLVFWSALRNNQQDIVSSRSHVAMPAIPGARRASGPRRPERPSLLTAIPLAGGLLAALIVVQLAFPSKTMEASKPELAATIDMTAAANQSTDSDLLSPDAERHVVNRPTDEDSVGDEQAVSKSEPLTGHGDSSAENSEDEAAAIRQANDKRPKLSREVTFLNGKIKLDMYRQAVIGSPNAKYVVAELMDYTCPHCRKMHAHLREARDRYGDQLAIVILPVPLELSCNKMISATDPMHRGACKIARTALAVAEVDPTKFIDFHNYLMAVEDKAPTASQAVMRAFRLVDRREFVETNSSKEIEGRIQNNIKLYQALAAEHRGETSFGLPVQIVGDTVLSGDATAEDLFESWEKAIDIKPR